MSLVVALSAVSPGYGGMFKNHATFLKNVLAREVS
jgi:hypothetical protein